MMILAYALIMGICGTIFFYIGISMGWLYLFMGTVLGSAVVPVALSITWSKANTSGCIAGAIGGFVAGLIAWLVTASQLNNHVLTAATTGQNYPMLAGNVASIVIGGVISIVWTLIVSSLDYFMSTRLITDHYLQKPNTTFTWAETRAINSVQAHVNYKPKTETPAEDDEKAGSEEDKNVHGVTELTQPVEDIADSSNLKGITSEADLDRAALKKAFKFSVWSSVALFVILIILVPLPLFFSKVVYGVKGFTAWTAIGMIWMFLAIFIVVLYPVYESREALGMVVRGVVKVGSPFMSSLRHADPFNRISSAGAAASLLRPLLRPPRRARFQFPHFIVIFFTFWSAGTL